MKNKSNINFDIVLDAMLTYSNDITILVANDFGIEILNPASEKFFKWKLKNVQRKSFLDLCKTQHFSCPIPEHFFKHPELLSFNLDCKNSSGYECNLNWTICPLILPKNKVVGALIIGKDIEFKKNNIAYHLNGIIDAIPGCLYWKDCNGYYLGCNNLTAKLAGLSSPYEVIGKNDEELWGEQAASLIINDREVITKGITIIVEEKLKTAADQWMHFTGVKMPLRDENNRIIGLIGNSLDITELKKTQIELKNSMEMVKAANRAKNEFITNMSHDIRTPLTGVIGLSEILESTLKTPEQKENAHLLHDSGEELLNMLNDILDDVRADHMSEADIQEEPLDLFKCLDDLIKLELPTTKIKNLGLKLIIAPDVPRFLISDRKKIQRILLNLVSNAIKFTQSGQITIEVTCLDIKKSRVHLQFGVADTGIGIPEELQSQVFDRFFRVTSSYKGLYQGHGLGLHIAQSYVSLLGGHITLTSEEGVGSTFYFDLSCKLGRKKTIQRQEGVSLKPIQSMLEPKHIIQPLRIEDSPFLLLVEDNPSALKILKNLSIKNHCRFASAKNGEDALELVKSNRFDLIITDIGLPGFSGIELTQAIRAYEKASAQSSVPIIGLTAHGLEEAVMPCLDAGMNKVLQKPMKSDMMELMIEAFLQTKEPQISQSASRQQPNPMLGINLPASEDKLFLLDSIPLLDIHEGMKCLGSEALLKELLIQMADQNIPADVQAIQQAFKIQDWDQIEKIAHKIKGGAIYCGTIRLKLACQYLECYYKAGHRNQLPTLYSQLLKVTQDTIDSINHWSSL